MIFEWDEKKNRSNFRKHGFTFADAMRVFEDIHAATYRDRWEDDEERWHTVGRFEAAILLIVHTIEETIDEEEKIRIISARKANRRERSLYYPHH